MGCFASVSDSVHGGFKHDHWLEHNIVFNEMLAKLDDKSGVPALRQIISASAFTTTNPFYAVKISPPDATAGEQLQTSSIRPSTQNPRWEPPEVFRFIVTDQAEAKLILSVYQFGHGPNDENCITLGDAVISLDEVPVSSLSPTAKAVTPSNFMLPLINPSTGHQCGEADVMVSVLPASAAATIRHAVLYQYERWRPIGGWNMEHFLPDDPGGWSSEDGSMFGESLLSVAPAVPPGWSVTQSWSIMGTSKDVDGWQYNTSFDSPFWYPQNTTTTFVVRRRSWHREIRQDGTFNPDLAVKHYSLGSCESKPSKVDTSRCNSASVAAGAISSESCVSITEPSDRI